MNKVLLFFVILLNFVFSDFIITQYIGLHKENSYSDSNYVVEQYETKHVVCGQGYVAFYKEGKKIYLYGNIKVEER
jgi:hypothetical protein